MDEPESNIVALPLARSRLVQELQENLEVVESLRLIRAFMKLKPGRRLELVEALERETLTLPPADS